MYTELIIEKTIPKTIPKIEQVIPQKEGMKLIDRIIEFSDEQIVCESIIQKNNLFYDSKINGVYSWVGVEFMAQAIAAYAGCSKYQENTNNKHSIGFLLSVRKFSTTQDYFKCDDKLIIKAEKIYLSDGVGVFLGEIIINKKTIASAKLNTYQPGKDKVEQILKGNHSI
jgi:predicted hotdog family 3-hydroxylacyl-ACP dehydratase